MKIKLIFTVALVLFANQIHAAGFHYCTGKITDLITRATSEGTQVAVEGMNGSARVSFGGDSYSEMHQRQISMLIAAYMAGKTVQLEFTDNTLTCADDHNGMPIRFVRLR